MQNRSEIMGMKNLSASYSSGHRKRTRVRGSVNKILNEKVFVLHLDIFSIYGKDTSFAFTRCKFSCIFPTDLKPYFFSVRKSVVLNAIRLYFLR